MVDTKLTIVEAHTAKVVAEKTFTAPDECPMVSINETVESRPSKEQYEAWLRSERAKS
jgi:hypothetical protein